MNNKLTKMLIVSVLPITAGIVAASVIGVNPAYADCETEYGGGETCVFNKSFRITKDVRIVEDDNNDWADKVKNVKENETIEFRIKVKNIGDVKVDNMKVKDKLPEELERIGGNSLTKEWDDFEPGDTKEFVTQVKIKSSEFDKENFEKCVVNKAELFHNDDFEGADTATVCFKKGEISELPSTGPDFGLVSSVAGVSLAVAGAIIKKRIA